MHNDVFQNFSDLIPKEILPGFVGKLIHTETNSFNFIEAAAGSGFAIHSHPHQQCSFVFEGEFELTVGDTTQILNSGTFAVIPSNVPHGGKAITNCRLLDVFSPVREEYR